MSVALDNRMPPGIPYIVINEFAERFCYYGINSILAIYMVQTLQFGEAQATTWQSLFKSGAYFFPMVGAIISDVFWGKYRTVIAFSLAYVAGCAVLALFSGPAGLALGLFLIALGTGGIKPCVSTNVGDQFTAKNQHLIERAFSWFYLSINAGSLISIFFCPILLEKYGPKVAFGVPGGMMLLAVIVFWLGRNKFAVVPPAGKQWFKDVFSADGLALVGRLAVIYLFIAVFWALWDQSNGQTWTLQAQSDLMDKNLGFGMVMLPSQIQVVNALFILIMVPIFSYGIYPLMNRYFAVTPLRKIGIGLFITASSFLVIAWVESRIQNGHSVSIWWQILAYAILTAGEVLVSITALEFSYKQAPLRMKSFIMALFLLSVSAGNLLTAGVASSMVKKLEGVTVLPGEQTLVQLPRDAGFVRGQKIDFGTNTALSVMFEDGSNKPLTGTFILGEIRRDDRAPLLDVIHRRPVHTNGIYRPDADVSTYRLVGPQFFLFFAALMAAVGVLWIFVAKAYTEKTHVRESVA